MSEARPMNSMEFIEGEWYWVKWPSEVQNVWEIAKFVNGQFVAWSGDTRDGVAAIAGPIPKPETELVPVTVPDVIKSPEWYNERQRAMTGSPPIERPVTIASGGKGE